ncbi:hypothetical protein C923_03706 [Plasmodium falciparum UGT5.1]|uniref:Erythrocyte membrane protein 1, PfEMP1 n=1 Tax=Plasmodium falciparum UGT5.1 TaxID=1237627 RepID=W7JAE5_PLAFA|nr:hypothetical protein C923_03706 [Plasmodium falciparum UGT5.1]
MARGRGGTNKTAKEVLDEIGETIEKEVHTKAREYENDLHGLLSRVEFKKGENNKITNPCDLHHEYQTTVTTGHSNPCENRVDVRFSDVVGGQCTRNRIKDSESDSVGACAPYRRLHVCDQNLEQIRPEQITSTDNLLVDVLLAAKYEGNILSQKLQEYDKNNYESRICTVLARSFADIGDIVRGKDLYLGDKKEKVKLEKKLKEYFKKIYDKLDGKNGKKSAKDHYEDKGENYYKLREDWWNNNRKMVWIAMTCGAGTSAQYFRQTCGSGTPTNKQCRCPSHKVPTYFDYVPQFLRWFEEWAEDFCRIKRRKLQNLEKECRYDESGQKKYCSRNGYDCTKTIRSIDEYSMNRECTKCLYVCDPYVKWIDNKKKEFEKQKEKCEIEIYDDAATSQSSTKVYNNMYESHFYEHLKTDYQSMNDFLKLLNSETPCTNIIDPKSNIDFTKDPDDIFCHTEYCEPCPWCGLKEENGTWKKIEENDPKCPREAKYKPPDGVDPTGIDVIQKDKNGKDIVQMFQNFCNTKDNESGIKKEQWKCYYQEGNNKCVLENSEKLGIDKKVKDYVDFFMFWVTHMLKDSIEWRSKLGKCLKNDKNTCIRKCNDNCKCYEKWIKQKEKEWKPIKDHFGKQKNLNGIDPYELLEDVLELEELFKDITKAYGNAKELEGIKNMLEKKKKERGAHTSKDKTIIDYLLDHEAQEAKQCIVNHKDNNCPDEDSDSEDEEEDIPQRQNPCAKPSGSTYPVLANKVASNMHHKVHAEAKSRSGGKNFLKANAKEGKYTKGGIGKNLDATFCNIDTTYSNSRNRSDEPCQGKDNRGEMFQVEKGWKNGEQIKTADDVFLPPRRQHFCTSNLEFLQADDAPLDGKDGGKDGKNDKFVNDSFLGGILLSANKEAEWLKNKYKKQPGYGDDATICRAMKYSFADLGDIIKGTDLWDANSEEIKTQGKLVTIFGKIKKELPGEIQKRYWNRDDKHLDLRKDWWEANRRQVWKAMQCSLKTLKSSTGDCAYSRGTYPPVDDYIPQRLRWMTEWAEWFCKEQYSLYDELMGKCCIFMSKNKGEGSGKDCTKVDSDCTQCKAACDTYKEKIKKWQDQWNNMLVQYLLLYKNAEITDPGTVFGDASPDYQLMVDFFKELQKTIKSSTSKRPKRSIDAITTDPTTPYSSAAGYVHQEMGTHMQCKGQTRFCEETHPEYAFKEPPDGYDEACTCKESDEPPPPPPPLVPVVPAINVCSIVDNIFKDDNTLKNACSTKYEKGREKFPNWKCVSSGDKTDTGGDATTTGKRREADPAPSSGTNQGAICVPPRRRKLYLHDLKTLSGEDGKAPSQEDLLKWFVESAAIETFFLWDRYKKEWEQRNKKPQDGLPGGPQLLQQDDNNITSTEDGENPSSPQQQLEKGKIPEDFKRQMFYTLGDYRDILYSGSDDKNGGNNIILNASVNKDEKQKMEKIQEKIDTILKQSVTTPPKPGIQTQPSEKKREQFWKQHGEHIWNAMVCALTYKDSEQKGGDGKPEKVDGVNYQTLIQNNDYKIVKISSVPSGDTTLEKFSERPTYFRWLEEWGEEFCKKKKDKLAKVKEKCQGYNAGGHKIYCSGDGHDCRRQYLQHNDMSADPDCPDCYEQCRKYRKWIDIKFEEFRKQEKKYGEEHGKVITPSTNGDDDNKNFCEEIKNHSSAAEFLKELKHCKDNQGNSDQDNKIDFTKPLKTFSPSTYCKTCPLNGVHCGVRDCKVVSGKEHTWENVLKRKANDDKITTIIDLQMIDRRGPYMENDLKHLFKTSSLFKGIRKQNWTCKVIDDKMDICELTNFDDKIDLNQYTTFKVLLEHWLQDFIESYYISKKKIDVCEKGENSRIQGCTNKCDCVRKWVDKKKDEWGKINDHFNKQTRGDAYSIAYKVRSCFEKEPFFSAFLKAMKGVNDIDDLKHLRGCTDDECRGNIIRVIDHDFITALLKSLQNKINKCNTHRAKPETQCEDPPLVEEEINPLDDDTTDIEKPSFCPTEEEKEETLCDSKNQPKCDGYYAYNSNTYKPKTNLIGLEAHNHRAGRFYPNVYISPRVQQLCLQDLQNLKENNTEKNTLIDALKKCAYNEAKGLYEYYKKNKAILGINDSQLSEKEIEKYILKAMERSYADYGSIVKGDILWDYEKKDQIDLKIIDFAKNHKSTTTSSVSTSDDDDVKRQNLWELIKTDVWKAMICGYKDAIGGDINSLPNGVDLCTLPSTDKDNQFLRWFEEWGENFCIRRNQELKRLQGKCENGICNDSDESKKEACQTLCKKYEQFLINSKIQYETQKPEYDNLMSSIPKHRKKDAIEFLKEKCNAGFSCFKDVNENEHNKIFQYPSDEVKNLCTCTSTDTSKTTPTNCIDKAAYELQQKITKNIGNNSKNLKGKEIALSDCRKGNYVVVDNGVDGKKIDKDKLKQFFPPNIYSCEPKEFNSFHVGKEWDCNYRNINDRAKNLCLPPRRRFMCMKKLEHISAKVVEDKENLLRIVMEVGKEEGIRILRNYQEQNKTDFSEICDDMKYSFADLGDIIRGRDLWKEYPNYHTTEQNLQRIFKNIHNEITKGGDKDKYKYDRQYFHELRNDWWNTNREAIWKAITCSTPRSAYIYKKTNTGENIRSTDMYYYCGYTKEPPYDDYIPQRLRWMKEWGEYVCKILNEKIDDIKKECDKCNLNDKTCSDDDDGNKCTNCKEKCKEYTELIHNLKSQFSILEKKYNELYTKAKNNSGGFIKDNDKYVIEFLKEVEKTGCDVKSFDKYLDKTSHCINYKFNEKEKEKETYAFNLNSNVFKEKCKCGITNDPLDKCPDQNTCTKYHAIQCFGKEHDDNAYWLSTYIKDNKAIIKNVLVPPRRRHLCLRIEPKNIVHLRNDIKHFKNFIFSSAFSEAKRLKKVYKDDNDKLLQAMKYSFSDIGSVVKGNDMMESPTSTYMDKLFTSNKYPAINRKTWWNENKYHVWHAMLCGYQKSNDYKSINASWCTLPDEDKTDQFLRWFQEWTEIFCNKRKKLYDILVAKCKEAKCDENTCDSDPSECTKACRAYENYVLIKKKEYDIQKNKYDAEFKRKNDNKEAHDYFKDKCKDGQCACLYEKFNSDNNWKNPYDTFDDDKHKDKCDCPKPLPPLPVEPPQAVEPFDPTILQTTIPFGIAIALTSIVFLFLKKKTKSTIDLLRVINIPKSDYNIPTKLSPNRYIPYTSGKYRGKRYIYLEGDSGTDSGYTDHYSDIDFISQYLQSEPNTEPNMLGYNVDNNTHPTMSRDNMEEKPFIMSIHDRNLYSGEEYNYNVNMVNNDIPMSDKNGNYTGMDLINDSLSGDYDIYDEMLKRKENELFGTNHVKQTSIHSVAKNTNSDPIDNQLDLFHTWLDRHRDMCEQWNNKEELLDKLKEEWENETHSGNTKKNTTYIKQNWELPATPLFPHIALFKFLIIKGKVISSLIFVVEIIDIPRILGNSVIEELYTSFISCIAFIAPTSIPLEKPVSLATLTTVVAT